MYLLFYSHPGYTTHYFTSTHIFYRTQVCLGSDLWVPVSVCLSVCQSQTLVDLTDVSLVDEDANLILADDTNRAIPGNLKMQVAPPGDQI